MGTDPTNTVQSLPAGIPGSLGGGALSSIAPEPTQQEVAAIMAAIGLLMAAPVDDGRYDQAQPSRWKFSGRWWMSAGSSWRR